MRLLELATKYLLFWLTFINARKSNKWIQTSISNAQNKKGQLALPFFGA